MQDMLKRLLADLNITPVAEAREEGGGGQGGMVKFMQQPPSVCMRPTSLRHVWRMCHLLFPSSLQASEQGEPVSVLLPLPKPQGREGEKEREGVVEWTPPHIDWNPWSNRSAYQESLPYSELEPVSPDSLFLLLTLQFLFI